MTRSSKTFGLPALLFGSLAVFASSSCSGSPPPAPSGPRLDPALLEGRWTAEDDADTTVMTVTGDTLHFYRRDDFQYDARFTLADGEPAEMYATVLDTPRTSDSVGELVVAVFELHDDALRLAVVGNPEQRPYGFDDGVGSYDLVRDESR